jgi:hypothetical protein
MNYSILPQKYKIKRNKTQYYDLKSLNLLLRNTFKHALRYVFVSVSLIVLQQTTESIKRNVFVFLSSK